MVRAVLGRIGSLRLPTLRLVQTTRQSRTDRHCRPPGTRMRTGAAQQHHATLMYVSADGMAAEAATKSCHRHDGLDCMDGWQAGMSK